MMDSKTLQALEGSIAKWEAAVNDLREPKGGC
jgi:hypothetical protein